MQTACNTSMFVECLGQLGVVGWAHRQQPDSLGSSPTSAQMAAASSARASVFTDGKGEGNNATLLRGLWPR